ASDLDKKADKDTVMSDLAKKADKDASNIGDTERTAWANKLGTGTISDNDANLVTGGTVKAALDKKVDTSTYTEGMAKKADVDGGNITAPGKWAEKLGTGVIADKDTNLVTGGKVYAAIKDKADKSELTNKADTSLNTITEAGKTVIKDLAKGAVKVADGTNTTVTTEDGKDGSKTYKVNVSDADIKKAVASDLDKKADKDTVTSDLAKKADKNAGNIGDAERTAWAGKLGTGTVTANDGNLVTGKTVYDFANPIKTKADNNEKAITQLQEGFTIQDEATPTAGKKVIKAKDTITFKSGANLTSKVGDDGSVTYGLNSALTNMNRITFAAPTPAPGATSKALTIDGTAGTITGLTNTTWNANAITSGRAATEDQLKSLSETVSSNASGSTDYQLVKAGTTTTTDGNGVYTPGTDGKIDLLVQDKKHKGNIETITISDVAKQTELVKVQKKLEEGFTVGEAGEAGKDGKVEVIGKDGSSVVINGKDGSIGLNGTNGQNGLSIRGEKGTEGKPGVDGTTTIKRIVIADPTGQNPHSVATLDDGLRFAGNVGNFYSKLNETVEIVGGVTVGEHEKAEDKLTDENIGVVANKEAGKNGKLDIKLAKNLKDLSSATFTKTVQNGDKEETTSTVINDLGTTVTDKDGNTNQTTAGGTVIQTKDGKEKVEIKKDGITITDVEDGTSDNPKKKISLTKDGFNNGGNKITNIANGEKDSDAATVGQVNAAKQAAMDTLAAGFDVKAGTVTGTVSLKANEKPTVEFLSAGNGLSVDLTTDAATHTQKITYRLSDTPVFGEKAVPGEAGKPGKDGKDGKVEVVGKDGSAVVINGKDGSIGLNGTNGQNGLSIRGEKGTEGTSGVDGKTPIKRLVITDPDGKNPHSVATLDDGLKFAGDSGDAIAKKLNETVTISGGVTDETKLSDNNIGVVAKDGKLNVKLAKNLTGLESATFTDKDGNTNKTTAGGTVIQNKAGTEKVEITKNGITITDVEDGTSDNPKKKISLTKDGFNNGGNKITNIANGEKDSDAATVGQVNEVKNTIGKDISNLKAGFKIKGSTGESNVALGDDTQPTIEFAGDGNLTSKVEKGKITYSLNNKITIGGEKDKKVTVDGTTGTITGLTNTKWDSKNITSGRAATEDQLNDVQASVQNEIKDIKELSDKTVTYKDKEKNEIALAGKAGTKITNLKNGDIAKDSKDAVNGGQLFAAKNDLRLKEGTVSYDEKTGNGVMTLTQGDGETANKVEVKGLQNTYTASGRYDEKGKKIEFKRNDGKLYNVDMSPLVNGIQQGMNVLQDKVVRAGASSAALASLHPLEYDPDDKWDVAAGVGNYMGANAVAIGAFYRPNENTMFSMGGSFGSGHNMVNAGVSLKVGRGIALISTKAVMAREIIQLKENSDVKDEEIRYLKEKEAKHEEQIQQLMAMVTALQQKK
ncbi:hypothetical protein C3L57_03085, partial [Veillonellaceae bacterium M2-8]|nr:hypothetical protein [Veillonellaceae bacterium M2-8]